LDHPHAFHLFGTVSIYCRFQKPGHLLADQQGKEQTHNAGAPPEPTEHEHKDDDCDEQWPPDLDVAEPSHEQIQRGMRPPFVDELEKRLIHMRPFTIGDSLKR
jgi:hypothetical protein